MKAKREKKAAAKPAKSWLASEAAAAYGKRTEISVREAKDSLSSLLERAAQGEEIVITSDGKPKATLSRYRPRITGTPYKPNWDLLRSMPMTSDSTEAIRRMRDAGH
jgi:prevent-host-death family protein